MSALTSLPIVVALLILSLVLFVLGAWVLVTAGRWVAHWRTDTIVGAAGIALASVFFLFVSFVAAGLVWHQAFDNGGRESDPQALDLESGTYVAIGDSYSAGEGNPPWVDANKYRCDRSKKAYSQRLHFTRPTKLIFIACSGARIDDVLHVEVPGLHRASQETLQLEALGSVHDLRLVTVTISGNDAEFSDVLTFCATRTRCLAATYRDGKTLSVWAHDQLDNISRALPDLFSRLRTAAGDARVIVLGYPQLFRSPDAPTPGPFCSLVLSRWGGDEQRAIRELETDFNERINRAATGAGLEFVATDEVFAGHEACSRDEWVRPVTAGRGAFHPNVEGQLRMAYIVECDVALHPSTSYLYDRARTFGFDVAKERVNASPSGGGDDTDLKACALSDTRPAGRTAIPIANPASR